LLTFAADIAQPQLHVLSKYLAWIGEKLLRGAYVSMWEPKLELDPLRSLRPLFVTCGPGGKRAWESDALAAARGCELLARALGLGQKPLHQLTQRWARGWAQV